jgi:hypothetical protein
VKPEDAAKIRKLFEDNFPELYKWWSTSLNLVMEVIQVIHLRGPALGATNLYEPLPIGIILQGLPYKSDLTSYV